MDRETGYEKDKVTRRVNRWTSRQVNKLLEMGDKVTRQVDRWTSRQVNKLLEMGDRVTDEQVR